ncbi:MAG: hypothetical protein HF982_10705 [Desulfobacteraceae bacterium]|nr:hypothetical protein [Desulfobacteraceae bacterium]MBC2720035.1 hypothetical protein [Desulfobacteraceae bacterium]
MKRFWHVNLALLITFLFSIGCETTKNIQKSITSLGSPAYRELITQVPADMKDNVYKAEFDMKISREKLKLAKLKNKLAVNQKNYSAIEVDLAKKLYEKAEITLEIQKLEAIMKSGLGENKNNIKTLANLKSKKLRTEAGKIKIEAELETTELVIRDLLKQIKARKEMIKDMNEDEDSITKPIEMDNQEQES